MRGLDVRRWAGGPLVLERVDLDLAPGRSVALVGESGAGKTTLAEVLLRFLPYESGSVELSGVEIDTLDADAYRKVVGMVAQDAHIFDTTLGENLRLARRDATDAELCDALARAGLLEWVRTLPAGLGTEVGAMGARLSGGERRRLAIARAFLAAFPVLLLDEPGEHLDEPTADAILADVLESSRDTAVLLITHRLAALDAVDEVLVLDHGRVIERGSHEQLVADGGRYAELWRRELAW